MKSLKRIIAILIVVFVLGALTVFAESASTEAHIKKMMSLISKQNFANTLGVDYVKEKVNYLVYDSEFAASKTSYFPYSNSGAGYSSVKDNGTETALRGTTWGCMTYARYVNTVVNGSDPATYDFLEQEPGEVTGEGLKNFLLTHGQAGEHLRIDTTHSVAFIAGDDYGFYYFNYNTDSYPYVTMEYESYEDFANRYKDVPINTEDGVPNIYAIWLYRSNANINKNEPEYFIPGDVAHVTPAPVCKHEKYSSAGYCKGCGQEFPLNVEPLTSTEYTVIESAPIRPRPYAVVKQVTRFRARDKVTVVGKAYNSYGKLWYRVKSDKLGLNTFWVYSENVARINDVSIELTDITDIGESSLTVNGVCSYTLRRPDRVVLLLGTSKDKMSKIGSDVINHNMNPFKIWYKLSGIKKDTLYYYQLLVEYDNLEYSALIDKSTFKTKIGTFMISSEKTNETVEKPDSEVVDNTTAGLLDAIVPVKLDVKSVTSLAQTSARFNASCTYIETRPSYVSLYLGLSADTNSMWQVGYDKITHSKNPFDIWYDVSGMAENTVYYYQFRAEADGKMYTSDVHTVTTMNKAPIDNAMDAALGALGALSNTRTGVISGTSLLAINDKAAASPTNSTMIGTVPEGAYVTVYPDKQSGSWYYITYNGVSGYAYGKYITLK